MVSANSNRIFYSLGELTRDPTYFWEPRGAVIKPHLFDATLSPHGLRIEVTPSMHVRFDFFSKCSQQYALLSSG